jgi:ribosome-binding factor A
MADPARARRLAKRISTIVATAIDHEIKDPRLAFVTVTDAKVTADLHDATVYYTVMGENIDTEPDLAGAAAGLEKAKGVLRSKVGAGTGVRFTPTLTFVADTVPDTARHMEELVAGRRRRPVQRAPCGRRRRGRRGRLTRDRHDSLPGNRAPGPRVTAPAAAGDDRGAGGRVVRDRPVSRPA